MSDETVITHCSPTLAGIKTGNIFSYPVENRHELKCAVRRLNGYFVSRGLRAVPLRVKNGRALMYVYRPCRLSRDLRNTSAAEILYSCGYDVSCHNKCVCRLAKRLQESDDFPHEIGLFLGYPPEDVRGFIENTAPCKLSGCWKVYGDEEGARRLFARYKKCTAAYRAQLRSGRPFERLIVKAV